MKIVTSLCLGLLLLHSTYSIASADDRPWCALLLPDSLAGWEHGVDGTSGWKIKDGELSAKGAKPLLSGYTFGDFQLRLSFATAKDATIRLVFPQVPQDAGLEVLLRDGDGCGAVREAGNSLAKGIKLVPTEAAAMHQALLERTGGKLRIAIDGKSLGSDIAVPADRRFGLGLAADGEARIKDMQVSEPAGTPMLSKDGLDGWWTPGKLSAWNVNDGTLTLTPGGGNYLRSEKLYGNFTLALQYKSAKRVNSGIGIRTPRQGWPSGDGMEVQIEDRPLTEKLHKHSPMAIYGNVPPLARHDKSEAWNWVVIKADGYMISAWVNGQLVQQTNTFFQPELRHRNLEGWIGFQDHGGLIEFKDLTVLESPAGRGLDAWYAAKKPNGGATVIDRLMNPAALSLIDGVRGGAMTKQVELADAAEEVLADLKGPGAVTWIARADNDGRLAFFFDGEKKPRLECKPNDLRGALPELTENNNPVTTCLLYRKSLKIVLSQAKRAAYRIEYVTFPKETVVDSFSKKQNGLPRGWSDAALYRSGMYSHGVQRENDGKPRLESPKVSIEPGQTVELARLESAGLVSWLRLKADKKVLDNTDLWLEVAVDGEATPAIAAPVRYWFPGLAGQGNFANYLMTDRGGPALMLAMPYAKGLVVSARNCGEKKIDNVGVLLGYDTDAGTAARMRLRAVYQPAGDGDELVKLAGAGRCVGLVYEQSEGSLPGLAAIVRDGKTDETVAADNLNLLLGQSGEKSRAALGGRNGGLVWRYWQSAPLDVDAGLILKAKAEKLGNRLMWFYEKR